MSLQLPEGMMQALASQGSGAPPMPPDQGPPPPLPAGLAPEQDDQEDPLAVLQECIQELPKVIAALPDPQDTQDAIQALHILAKIQTRLSSGKGAQSGAAQG